MTNTNDAKKSWLRLGEVEELARKRVQISRSKLLQMLREDAASDKPVVEVQVFPACKHRRYERTSVCRLLQIQ